MTAPPRRAILMLALVLLLGAFAFEGLRPLADLDVWWHIRLGEVMVQTSSLVPSDVFSYTRFGTPWPWKDWGTALLLYGTWSLGGVTALVLLKGSMLVGTGALQWWQLHRVRNIAGPVVVLAVAVCMSAASFRFSERGATVSLVAVAAVMLLIDRHRAGKSGLAWAVPLVVLNANIHRGVLLVPVVLGALAGIEWFETFILKRERPWKHTLAVAVAGSASVLLTPFGIRIITTTVALMGQHSGLITEWMPVTYDLVSRLSPATLAAIPFIAIGAALQALRNRDPWDVAIVVLGFALGMQSIRHLPYIALLGAGPAASGWSTVGKSVWSGKLSALLSVAPALGALLYALGRPLPPPSFSVAPAHFPEKGVAYVRDRGLQGPMFNQFGYGGYLLFHLWPEHKVYIDGRTDLVYTPQMVERFIASKWDPEVFAAEASARRFQFVIIDNTPISMNGAPPPFAHLDTNAQWVLVHASRRALIYVKRGGLNDALIETDGYRWLWPHALLPSIAAAQQQGHGSEAMAELQRMRIEDPDNVYAEMVHRQIERLQQR